MDRIEDRLREAESRRAAGDREGAIRAYMSVYRDAYGNGAVKQALDRIAKDLFAEAIAVRDTGDVEGAVSLMVRSLELNPHSGEVRAEANRLRGLRGGGRDLTRECFIFPDAERATRIYTDAIQTVFDFVAYGGVVGDVLEFGVLAGWTARLFAEHMLKYQFFGDLYLFDSFAGLPRQKSAIDDQSYDVIRGIWSQEMELPSSLIDEIGMPIEKHIVAMLSEVIGRDRIHVRKGFFSESLRDRIAARAAIVHLDCDLYQSTAEVLEALDRHDSLQDGTVLMFDDWNCNRGNPAFGQRRALDEFLANCRGVYTVSHFFNYGFNCAAFILHDLRIQPKLEPGGRVGS